MHQFNGSDEPSNIDRFVIPVLIQETDGFMKEYVGNNDCLLALLIQTLPE